jgi:hypothetical protein
MIVNAHYINPFKLNADLMEFDLILEGDSISHRGAKMVSRPVSLAALTEYANFILGTLSTGENPLTLGTVTAQLPSEEALVD